MRDAIEMAIHKAGGFEYMSQEDGNAMARAAIEAMREPTEEMSKSAVTDDLNKYDAEIAWQAMINTALN